MFFLCHGQKSTDKYIDEIDKIADKKKKEIMEI